MDQQGNGINSLDNVMGPGGQTGGCAGGQYGGGQTGGAGGWPGGGPSCCPPGIPPMNQAGMMAGGGGFSGPPRPIPVYAAPAMPARKVQGRSIWGGLFRSFMALIFVLSIIMNLYLLVILKGMLPEEYHKGDAKQRIALIDLQGTIGMETAAEMRKLLKRAEEDETIKGVIVVVNSPGGYVVPSAMIRKYLDDMRARGKKVYAAIEQVGASGAYWAVSGTERIYAQENAAVGSIGVIYMNMVVKEGLKKLGVEPVVLKSTRSPHKDKGSFLREPNDAEMKDIKEDLDTAHKRFVKIVAEGRSGRGLTEEMVWKLASGDVYDGPKSLDKKLIDRVGYLDDAIEDLTKELGIKNPMVIRYNRPLGFMGLLSMKGFNSTFNDLGDIQKQLEKWLTNDRIQALWVGR